MENSLVFTATDSATSSRYRLVVEYNLNLGDWTIQSMVFQALIYLQLIALTLLLLASLFFVKKIGFSLDKRPYLFLFCLLFFKSLSLLDYIIWKLQGSWVTQEIPLLNIAFQPALFLYAPALLFYIKSCTNKAMKLSYNDLLHLVPVICFTLLLTSKYITMGHEAFIAQSVQHQLFSALEIQIFFQTRYWLVLGYTIWGYILLRHYRVALENIYSDDKVTHLQWLSIVTIGIGITTGILALETLLWKFFTFVPDISRNIELITFFVMFIFANILLLKGMGGSPWMLGHITEQASKQVSSQYVDKLMTAMQSDKLFLNPELTLHQLAQEIQLSPRTVSELIKASNNENFYRFVNRYRVEEAKQMLKENTGKTITSILYDCGFSSKSTFNDAFKHHTGVTPSNYRKGLH